MKSSMTMYLAFIEYNKSKRWYASRYSLHSRSNIHHVLYVKYEKELLRQKQRDTQFLLNYSFLHCVYNRK